MTKPVKIPGRILSVKNNALDLDIEAAFKGFGSRDGSFVLGLSVQLASLGSKPSGLDEHGMAFLASIVAGVSPRDTTEALLATQMAAVHKSIILMTKRLGEAENIAQQDSAERALNKLARTFAMQVEALQRYRGVHQSVTVGQVTVNDGGQAVVGNVEQKANVLASRPDKS